MKHVLACAALLAGLAACSPKEETAADPAATTDTASGPSAAAPAAATPDVPAELAEGPDAGKWKITITSRGQTLPAQETCYATKTSLADAQKMQQQAGVVCSEQSFRKEGDGYVGHSVCTMDMAGQQVKMTTDSRVAGNFSTKYTMDIKSKMEPEPAPGMGETEMSIVSERIGDC